MRICENQGFSNIRKYFGFSNKTLLIAIIAVLMLASIVSAETTPGCSPSVVLLNQDPNPGMPDSYLNIVFMMSGISGSNCEKGAWMKLMPSYPFLLEAQEALKTIDSNTYITNQNTNWMVPYKLRVDKDALEGEYDIEIHYGANGVSDPSGSYKVKMFNLTLKDSRTSFDALIQEVSGSDVTIALANSGKNVANSVVVRIPEQDNFRPVGTDGQMVGNLVSGDYTVVGFTLSPKGQMNRQNLTRDNFQQMQAEAIKNLKFDIYYTDSLGVRRIINTELPLDLTGGSMNLTGFGGAMGARRTTAATSAFSLSSLLTWQVIAALLIGIAVSFVIVKKVYAGRKAHSSSLEVPDWAKETGKKQDFLRHQKSERFLSEKK